MLVPPQVRTNGQSYRRSLHTPGQGPAPLLAEPTWVCPHRQGDVLILESATSQNSGHFLDRWCCCSHHHPVIALMPGWTRQALWFGPGSFLIVASGAGHLRVWHIKIPSICLDAFTYHVSYSSCQPCLSPFSQCHPLPSCVQPT